jgi:hypothetical protein
MGAGVGDGDSANISLTPYISLLFSFRTLTLSGIMHEEQGTRRMKDNQCPDAN